MSSRPAQAADATWTEADDRPFATLARNITTRYVAIAVELVIGLVMLPFNLHHLGQEAYGLWMLTASVTIHFSILDMGFGGALVNFIARYRAHRDTAALNEIASTTFTVSNTIVRSKNTDRFLM